MKVEFYLYIRWFRLVEAFDFQSSFPMAEAIQESDTNLPSVKIVVVFKCLGFRCSLYSYFGSNSLVLCSIHKVKFVDHSQHILKSTKLQLVTKQEPFEQKTRPSLLFARVH
jgi:hypothetical protein